MLHNNSNFSVSALENADLGHHTVRQKPQTTLDPRHCCAARKAWGHCSQLLTRADFPCFSRTLTTAPDFYNYEPPGSSTRGPVQPGKFLLKVKTSPSTPPGSFYSNGPFQCFLCGWAQTKPSASLFSITGLMVWAGCAAREEGDRWIRAESGKEVQVSAKGSG